MALTEYTVDDLTVVGVPEIVPVVAEKASPVPASRFGVIANVTGAPPSVVGLFSAIATPFVYKFDICVNVLIETAASRTITVTM